MHAPTYVVFGVLIVIMGVVQFLIRKWQGKYAFQQWKSLGLDMMARTPEFWTRVSIPISVILVVVGLVFVAAGFI